MAENDAVVSFPPKSALTPEELKQPGVVRFFAGQPVDDGEKAQVCRRVHRATPESDQRPQDLR